MEWNKKIVVLISILLKSKICRIGSNSSQIKYLYDWFQFFANQRFVELVPILRKSKTVFWSSHNLPISSRSRRRIFSIRTSENYVTHSFLFEQDLKTEVGGEERGDSNLLTLTTDSTRGQLKRIPPKYIRVCNGFLNR